MAFINKVSSKYLLWGLALISLSGTQLFAQDAPFETHNIVQAELVQKSDHLASIILTIQEGWHVNANPVTMDFLVPTEIKSADDSKNLGIKVDYPASQIMDTPLGKIAVYSGKTEIPFTIKEVKQNQKISLTAQACDGKTCYPPSTWDFTINPIPAPKEKQSTK